MCYGSCYLQSELSEDSEKKTELPMFKTKEVQPLFSQSMAYQPDVVHLIPLENIPYPNYMDTLVITNFIYAVFQPPEWV